MKVSELISLYEGDDEHLNKNAEVTISHLEFLNTDKEIKCSAKDIPNEYMRKSIMQFYILDGKLHIVLD